MFKFAFKFINRATVVTQGLQKAKRKGLYRVAGLIRTSSIRNIRISSTVSLPGRPPHAKKRGGLREIKFDVYNNGAIIGPVKFPGSNFFDQPVPHIHEFGGTYIGLRGYYTYPERSYMNYTLKQLQQRGAIPKEFNVGMAVLFNK